MVNEDVSQEVCQRVKATWDSPLRRVRRTRWGKGKGKMRGNEKR